MWFFTIDCSRDLFCEVVFFLATYEKRSRHFQQRRRNSVFICYFKLAILRISANTGDEEGWNYLTYSPCETGEKFIVKSSERRTKHDCGKEYKRNVDFICLRVDRGIRESLSRDFFVTRLLMDLKTCRLRGLSSRPGDSLQCRGTKGARREHRTESTVLSTR